MEGLDEIVILFLIFGGTTILFHVVAAAYYIAKGAQSFQSQSPPHANDTCYFLVAVVSFFIVAIIVSVRG